MSSLSRERCEACRADAPRVSDEELRELMPKIPDWSATVVDGVMQLTREYRFADFVQAMAFANRVGEIAEAGILLLSITDTRSPSSSCRDDG